MGYIRCATCGFGVFAMHPSGLQHCVVCDPDGSMLAQTLTPTTSILPCLHCGHAMDSHYTEGRTYLTCERFHSFVFAELPDSAIGQYNLVASNYAEAVQSIALNAATIARQASIIEGLKRQLKKLTPPAAVAPYHRLYTEDSE